MDKSLYLKNEYAPVVEAVAKEHGIKLLALIGDTRSRKAVNARADLADRLDGEGLSCNEIGLIMNRHHTTVLHLLGKTKKGKIYAEKFERKGSTRS